LLQSAINKAFLDQTLAALFLPDFGMDYPMIQYADDTLIMMPACTQQVMVMKDILDKYAASTGLHIITANQFLYQLIYQMRLLYSWPRALVVQLGRCHSPIWAYLWVPLDPQ
jgi:hypothetical protein